MRRRESWCGSGFTPSPRCAHIQSGASCVLASDLLLLHARLLHLSNYSVRCRIMPLRYRKTAQQFRSPLLPRKKPRCATFGVVARTPSPNLLRQHAILATNATIWCAELIARGTDEERENSLSRSLASPLDSNSASVVEESCQQPLGAHAGRPSAHSARRISPMLWGRNSAALLR